MTSREHTKRRGPTVTYASNHILPSSKNPNRTGQKLPPENVRDQILTFLLAGHDSTSTAITCLFLLLAQHGDVERRVAEEVHFIYFTFVTPLEMSYIEISLKTMVRWSGCAGTGR